LLDVMMPGMDGYEVCKQLKADPRTAHLPVVIITALDQPNDKRHGLEVGADDFLTKPTNDLALTTRVKSLSRLKMATDELHMRVSTGKNLGLQNSAADVKDPKEGREGRVLIVDDRASSYESVVKTLSKDHAVTVVTRPQEAVFKAADEEFDLIIISLDIEGFDALRMCSQMRSVDRTRAMPILLIANQGDEARLIRAIDIGVNDYIQRPIDSCELLARARTQVRRKRLNDRLRQNVQQTMEMAVKDPLTGLNNRRYFDSHMQTLFNNAMSAAQPLSLVVMDIDHFKAVNDTYGHHVGDDVLKVFSERICKSIRSKDLACRFGGEEFVIAMPDTDRELAFIVADRMRREIGEHPFVVDGGVQQISVTVSAGIASVLDESDTIEAMLKRADAALYDAKRQGRNQVIAEAA